MVSLVVVDATGSSILSGSLLIVSSFSVDVVNGSVVVAFASAMNERKKRISLVFLLLFNIQRNEMMKKNQWRALACTDFGSTCVREKQKSLAMATKNRLYHVVNSNREKKSERDQKKRKTRCERSLALMNKFVERSESIQAELERNNIICVHKSLKNILRLRIRRYESLHLLSDVLIFFLPDFVSFSSADNDECELFDGSLGLCRRFFFVEFINGTVSSSLIPISFNAGGVFKGIFCVRLNLN